MPEDELSGVRNVAQEILTSTITWSEIKPSVCHQTFSTNDGPSQCEASPTRGLNGQIRKLLSLATEPSDLRFTKVSLCFVRT